MFNFSYNDTYNKYNNNLKIFLLMNFMLFKRDNNFRLIYIKKLN